jgi:O-antigen/teichoic acid export membrane protein
MAVDNITKRLIFAGATGWGYRAIAVLCNLANIALLFRFLEKQTIGLWFLMLGAQAFMGLFDLGFGQTLQRRIAFLKAKCGIDPGVCLDEDTKKDILTLLGAARRVYFICSIVIFGVVLIFGFWYFSRLDLSSAVAGELKRAWFVMSFGYAVNTWGMMIEAALNGMGDIGWTNIVNSVFQIFLLIANWIFLTLGFGLGALAVIWVTKGFLARLAGWRILVLKHRWISPIKGVRILDVIKDMVTPSLHWWLALAGYFFITGLSQYLIAHFMGTENVPDYAATYTGLLAAQAAMVGVVSAGIPIFSQLIRARDIAYVKNTILDWTKYGLGGLAIIFGIILVWGKEIIEMWLGAGHFIGFPTILVLVLMMFSEAHQGMLQTACVAAERLGFYKAVLLGGLISFFLSLLLIPRIGLLGAALAAFIGQVTTQHWVTPKLAFSVLGMRFREDLKRVLLPAVVLGGAIVIMGLGIKAIELPRLASYLSMGFLTGATIWFFYRKIIRGLFQRTIFKKNAK